MAKAPPTDQLASPDPTDRQHLSIEPWLTVSGLSCERGERTLFKRLGLTLTPGEMLQVTGPNGCGKTSLLRMLGGLLAPTTGTVRWLRGVSGISSAASPLLWIGHAAGINGLLTAYENLAWLGALHARCTRAACQRALEQAGLREFEDAPCHTLSAGQQRRVALARLYLPQAAPVWVLDEPFTALDKHGVAQLELHLTRHCANRGAVVLTSHHSLTHRPSVFRELDLGQYAA